jgi:fructokinase
MRIGVDLGGTKIEAAALDESGVERLRRRVSTPTGDYRSTIHTIVSLIDDIDAEVGEAASIGIGTPGAVSSAPGLLRNSNSTALNGMPFHRDLEAVLGRSVAIANDANCFALSESVDGAGAGCSVVFGVILGTGVGGGIVVDGHVLGGTNAIAGEWGHNPHPSARGEDCECYCGRSNCNERFLSGPALEADYLQTTGVACSAAEIAAKASSGDPDAGAVLDTYIDRLAEALAVVINILDPDAVVLGGGMSNVGALYDAAPNRWGQWVFSDAVSTPLRRAIHGDSSGVRGAARR